MPPVRPVESRESGDGETGTPKHRLPTRRSVQEPYPTPRPRDVPGPETGLCPYDRRSCRSPGRPDRPCRGSTDPTTKGPYCSDR